jgi:predicted MPP superfamily phosphohydrolase
MLAALGVRRVVSAEQLQPFGTFHAIYDGVLVTLPLIGLVLGAVAVRRRSGPLTLSACGLLVMLGGLGWYMTHIEPNWLRVDTIDVPVSAARAGDGTDRIAVLADLQTAEVGDHERAAVQAIMDGEPDVIVIPGDLYQPTSDGYFAGIEGVRELLATLDAPQGVYFTQGDHEDMPLARALLEDTGIKILEDEIVEIPVRGRRLLLGGTSSSVRSVEGDAVRARLDAEPEDGAITVLVSHRPDSVLHLPEDARVDLTIAGHTHGGQVVVPGFGPPLTLTEVPRDVARGGLHTLEGNQLYVSPGVGLERGDAPQLRLFNRPAVALLDLEG